MKSCGQKDIELCRVLGESESCTHALHSASFKHAQNSRVWVRPSILILGGPLVSADPAATAGDFNASEGWRWTTRKVRPAASVLKASRWVCGFCLGSALRRVSSGGSARPSTRSLELGYLAVTAEWGSSGRPAGLAARPLIPTRASRPLCLGLRAAMPRQPCEAGAPRRAPRGRGRSGVPLWRLHPRLCCQLSSDASLEHRQTETARHTDTRI